MFIQFGKDYAGAQSSIEWAEFAGGGLFEIVLTALLLAFTGGLGNAAQIASKVRHAARLRTLGGMLRKLGKLLQRKKLSQKTKGGVDSKHSVTAEKSEGQRLSSGKKEKPSDSSDPSKDSLPSKKVSPNSLADAETQLAKRREQIGSQGYKPKYSDAELAYMAKHGNVGDEQFQVRFMEEGYVDRGGPLQGKMGQVMKGKSGEGAKYWSTSFDQIEDADTDPKLISEKLGLEYDSKKTYALVVVDTQKAAPLTGVKSVPATFYKVGEFANRELPQDFPKSFTDKAMTPEFQAEYARHYNAAVDQKFLKDNWSRDIDAFEDYLQTTGMNKTEASEMKSRMLMHDKIGNNQDYLGNGLTKDINPFSQNEYGAVETLNFERKEINLEQLNNAGAITIIRGLSPI
jgi:hypothetical protein